MEIKNDTQFIKYLSKFKSETQPRLKPDQRVRKPNWFPSMINSMDQFNFIVDTCEKLKYGPIIRTEKGTIKKNLLSNA